MGPNYQAFTRKLPLKTIINEQYQELLRQKVIATSKSLREIVFRAMCFINHFCISGDHKAVPHFIFDKNFWYSLCQLVNGRKITNSKNTSDKLMEAWDACRAAFPNMVYKAELPPGASNCLSEACTELQTSYRNHIVENFEGRLIKYLRYRLQNMFIVSFFFFCLL